MVLEIKRLLYEERFTIEGARKFLETRSKPEPHPVAAKSAARKRMQGDLFDENRAADLTRMFDKVREELRAVAAILK
jgi:hypothetical protein